MRISIGSYPFRTITTVLFGTLFVMLLFSGWRTGELELIYFAGGISLFLGIIFFFLLPNTTSVELNDSTLTLKRGRTRVTEHIDNIEQLTELLNFTNQSFSNWSLYRLDFRTANELGDSIYFFTKKSDISGQGNRSAIGELNYKIELNNKTANNR